MGRYKQYYPSNKIKQLKNFKCIIQNKFKTDIYLQLLSNYFFRATISVYSSLKRHYAYAPVSFVHTILLTPLLFILCMFKNFGVHEISSLRQIQFGPKPLKIFFSIFAMYIQLNADTLLNFSYFFNQPCIKNKHKCIKCLIFLFYLRIVFEYFCVSSLMCPC